MITIVDYGRGNLFSLGQALRHLGADFVVSDDPEAVAVAERIILPGVGAFGDAVRGLAARGLAAPVRVAAAAGTPILGICVGCQLLLSRGEEFGAHAGLDLIPGTVARLPETRPDDPDPIRIPNVGWRQIETRAEDPLLAALEPDDMVYFVHSYAPMVEEEADATAWLAINGARVSVAVRRDNVMGVQFHPEKSGPVGLRILARFVVPRAEQGSAPS